MYRKNPTKWNCGWNNYRAEDLHRKYCIFEKNSQGFSKVFLISTSSTEQLLFERPLYRCFMITYSISSNFFSLGCYRLYNFLTSIFLVSSFIEILIYFISTEKWNKKGKHPAFCTSIDLFEVKDFRRNFKW